MRARARTQRTFMCACDLWSRPPVYMQNLNYERRRAKFLRRVLRKIRLGFFVRLLYQRRCLVRSEMENKSEQEGIRLGQVQKYP
jgi:hypothetical protein